MISKQASQFQHTPETLAQQQELNLNKFYVCSYIMFACGFSKEQGDLNSFRSHHSHDLVFQKALEGNKKVMKLHKRAAQYKDNASWWGLRVNYNLQNLYIAIEGMPCKQIPLPLWMRQDNKKFVADKDKSQFSYPNMVGKFMNFALAKLEQTFDGSDFDADFCAAFTALQAECFGEADKIIEDTHMVEQEQPQNQ